MADNKGFDLAAVLGAVSNLDTNTSGTIQVIPVHQIQPEERVAEAYTYVSRQTRYRGLQDDE